VTAWEGTSWSTLRGQVFFPFRVNVAVTGLPTTDHGRPSPRVHEIWVR
jgi:hypothetical protein